MQVLASVAPLADVDAADLADRAHGSLDPREHDAELRGEIVREVADLGDVLAGLENHDDGQAGRFQTVQAPALVRPEVLVVRRSASLAVDTACAAPRLLTLDGRLERARAHLAVEREGLPLVEWGHLQGIRGPLIHLLGGLGHREGDANDLVRSRL